MIKDGYVQLDGKQVSKQILKGKGTRDFLKELGNDMRDDINSQLDKPKRGEKARTQVQTGRKKRAAVDVVAGRTERVVKNHLLEKAAEKKRQ